MTKKKNQPTNGELKAKLIDKVQQLRIAQMEVSELGEQIEDLETKIELPDLKKRLEKKHFKYNNGFNKDDRWWLYYKVLEVKSKREIIVDCFETDAHGESTFRHRDILRSDCVLSLPISGRDYRVALARFKAKLNKL